MRRTVTSSHGNVLAKLAVERLNLIICRMQVSQAGSHLWYRKNASYRDAPPGKSASAPGKHRPEAGPFHLSWVPGHARTKHRGLNRRLDARHSRAIRPCYCGAMANCDTC